MIYGDLEILKCFRIIRKKKQTISFITKERICENKGLNLDLPLLIFAAYLINIQILK
ncbi:hypothetical protein MYP_2923 [Sporocytophaga myxococcoides]|uniref:Uncharacterized protein n=1 Tax=Sporocytophaga myxococcoides TaxID=153721 RepID=A0A098LGU4_9BACT|nr:hypothetical protein MYP_2923 [Sporocytophaga myxococcoides]